MTVDDPDQGPAPPAGAGWTPLELLIWRFKWVIAAGTLACVIAAGLVTVSRPPLYRAHAVIDPGDLRDEGRDVERLAARASAAVKPPGLIELAATARTSEGALAEVTESVHEVLPRLEGLMAIQRERDAATRRLADETRATAQRLRAAADAVGPRPRTPMEAAALANLLSHLHANEARLIELDAQVRLQEGRQTGPRLVRPATVAKVSIRRRLAANLAIGAVVGLAASVALAFALQYRQPGGLGPR
jgi:hypothetical protein